VRRVLQCRSPVLRRVLQSRKPRQSRGRRRSRPDDACSRRRSRPDDACSRCATSALLVISAEAVHAPSLPRRSLQPLDVHDRHRRHSHL
jgi:hypothetical protein